MNKREIQTATSALFATSTRAHGWLLVRAPSRFYRVLTPSLCSSKPSDSSTANSETKMAAVEQQKTAVAASPNTAAPPAHPIALNPDEKINFTLVAKTVSAGMCSWIVGAVNASSLLLRALLWSASSSSLFLHSHPHNVMMPSLAGAHPQHAHFPVCAAVAGAHIGAASRPAHIPCRADQ